MGTSPWEARTPPYNTLQHVTGGDKKNHGCTLFESCPPNEINHTFRYSSIFIATSNQLVSCVSAVEISSPNPIITKIMNEPFSLVDLFGDPVVGIRDSVFGCSRLTIRTLNQRFDGRVFSTGNFNKSRQGLRLVAADYRCTTKADKFRRQLDHKAG